MADADRQAELGALLPFGGAGSSTDDSGMLKRDEQSEIWNIFFRYKVFIIRNRLFARRFVVH